MLQELLSVNTKKAVIGCRKRSEGMAFVFITVSILDYLLKDEWFWLGTQKVYLIRE